MTFSMLNLLLTLQIPTILGVNSASHITRGKTLGLLKTPQCETTKFGLRSVIYQSILNWNELQQKFSNINLPTISRPKVQK